jgi:D-glycero-D-manno-heptose 1,7-bisphosphate phosphatase
MKISKPEHLRGIQFVILDRDGVINRKAAESKYIFQWGDFVLLPGVESAIAALNRSGRHVIVVTNQRGVSLCLYTLDQVVDLHTQLQHHLSRFGAHIDAFYICPHGHNACNCRKPSTGLLEEAFRDFETATKGNSLLIGDSLSDMQLARNFGIPSILIQNSDKNLNHNEEAAELALATAPSLWEAVNAYICPLPPTTADC